MNKIISRSIAVFILTGLFSIAFAKEVTRDQSSDDPPLSLAASQAIIVDQITGETLYAKDADAQKPIASITKLMTAMVTLDAKLSLRQKLQVTDEDVDMLRHSRSRLAVGRILTRGQLLQLALMSSENRAASALARKYPRGYDAFIAAMNAKAKSLGMLDTHFEDATGLSDGNVSTAQDLVKLVQAGYQYPLIRQITTTARYDLEQGRVVQYKNTNPLFKDKTWRIGLSKTGYIKPAGHCLVMQTQLVRPLIVVLLDAAGKSSIAADSRRIRKWIMTSLASNKLAANKDLTFRN
ncbi:MAG: peptidase S11 [Gammaproteobacteria bacterium]|nr:peptidase S11 [Gammaproteobacteria bacterium]